MASSIATFSVASSSGPAAGRGKSKHICRASVTCANVSRPDATTRRQALLSSAAALTLAVPELSAFLNPPAARADAESSETPASQSQAPEYSSYENPEDKYAFIVPAAWEKGEGRAGIRRVVSFHPEGRTDANVTMVVTPLGADFTKLGSFGTAYSFGSNLVNSLDRSWVRGNPGQKAVLIDAKEVNDTYVVEYSLQQPGEAQVHLMAAVKVAYNGYYNNLYTMTAQYPETDAAVFKQPVTKVLDSFRLTIGQ